MPPNRYWTRSALPLGPWPEPAAFELREDPVPEPGPGQALTRTIYISLDPYQWGYKKRGVEAPGAPCHARTVAQVIESRMEGGGGGGGGVLGLTAYAGMILQGDPKPGETAVVSAASGGVGQIAGQLARLRGARVVGIAGVEKKCRFVVEELGFNACVSHLSPTFAADLKAVAPAGVDVYFENVGGAVFDAVLPLFNKGARMTICGLIAHYGDEEGQDARADLMKRGEAIFRERGVTVRDLFVGDFVEGHHEAFLTEMSAWVAAGDVRYLEDIREGLETVPAAFAEMLRGGNFGKMLVRVGEDPTL